jgi:hydroxymethylglutaryl-CoA lyase
LRINSSKLLGCYEVSLGDTIGVGTPAKTYALLDALKEFPKG